MIPVTRNEPRAYTLNDKEIDIEEFISCNSETFEEARILRQDIAEMLVDYEMPFGGGAVPEFVLKRIR